MMTTSEREEVLNDIIENVKIELRTASSKFPDFNSSHEGFAILKEEVDELWDEVKANNKDKAKEECIQVAAMAIRFLMDC